MRRTTMPFLSLALAGVIACGTPEDPTGLSDDGASEAPLAAVRLEVPEDHPGNPFYALIFEGSEPASPHFFYPHADGWSAAFFERDPSCVPPDFNLLDEIDFTPAFPGGPPRSFLCTLTVEGHQIWNNPPNPLPVDPAPIEVMSRGLGAVPVIFARWEEVVAAMQDGVLTLPELAGLPSAIEGSADRFVALYVNGPPPDDRLLNKVEASGMLADGRTFRVHANETPAGTEYQVEIR